MCTVKNNFSLRKYNTFGVDVYAKFYAKFSSIKELLTILKKINTSEVIILGGGSNILFTKHNYDTVLHNNINGIYITKENKHHVWVEVGAGEIWHDFVLWSVKNNFSGVENLALIPGSVGASPIQNIGAYGMEVKDSIEEVFTIELKSGKTKNFNNNECKFKYRESIFKNQCKNKYIITKVVFKLSKKNLNITSYGDVRDKLKKLKLSSNPKNISDTIISIRNKKLPDPKELANCGSFFKNPTIELKYFKDLKIKFPQIIGYKVDEKKVKVAAGWLIDNLGLKGFQIGDVGIHKYQALVIVNYGQASGQEILDFANMIKEKIKVAYNISLENEVTIL
tara:strand:- start:7051 stop:8061 length:1011 start_codon:yes stop_codon:yes gene_type:complete